MRDDALAPVIAAMLILAAIVTFFSIYNAIYVPSMKESSEVDHLHNVESSFQHFSSDVDNAASSHQNNLVFSEPVQLGGGDFMFNLLKSSGTLNVQNEGDPIYNLTITNETGSQIVLFNGTIVTFSYEPTGNFWQDQGYQWQYGYLNVTKYGTLITPLQYYTMTDVNNAFNNPDSPLASLASSFGEVDYAINETEPSDDVNPGGNCSNLNLWAVNVTTSPEHNFISSNGYGTLSLTSTINKTIYFNVANISVGSDNEAFGDATLNSWNIGFIAATTGCPGDIGPDPIIHQQWNVTQTIDRPVTVTVNTVNIEISVH